MFYITWKKCKLGYISEVGYAKASQVEFLVTIIMVHDLEPKDGREILVSECCLPIKPKDCFVQNPIEHCWSGNCQFLECHLFFAMTIWNAKL